MPFDTWYSELVVKRLRCINCFNCFATNCVSFKSWGVVPSFHIKVLKRRTIQAYNLMHSIKNGKILFWANFSYLSWAEGVLPLPPLGAASLYRCFPVSFTKYFRAPFLKNMSGWLLLQNIFWFATSTTTTKCVTISLV